MFAEKGRNNACVKNTCSNLVRVIRKILAAESAVMDNTREAYVARIRRTSVRSLLEWGCIVQEKHQLLRRLPTGFFTVHGHLLISSYNQGDSKENRKQVPTGDRFWIIFVFRWWASLWSSKAFPWHVPACITCYCDHNESETRRNGKNPKCWSYSYSLCFLLVLFERPTSLFATVSKLAF